jgi:tetratricopeptide (TPR) repeat protein
MSPGLDPTRESIQRAAELLQRGAVDEATAILNGIITKEPRNGDALNLLGIAYAQRQDFFGAADVLQRATQMNPQHPGAQLNYGNALKRLGRLPEAADALRKSVALRPDGVPARRLLASVLLETRNFDEAIEQYTQVMRTVPADHATLNDRGLAYLARRLPELALADFEAALRLKPEAASTLSNKGIALQQLGRDEEGLRSFEAAERLDPSNPAAQRARAQALFVAGRYADAISLIESALRVAPDFAPSWTLHGEALRMQGQIADALVSYGRALAIDPREWDALVGLAAAHIDAGNFQAAVDAYNEAAPLRPEHAGAYLGRARAARGLGNLPAALYDLDLALKYEPDNIDALTLRAAIRRDLNQPHEALVDCERALAIEPANWNMHNNRGVLLDEMGRSEEALQSFERSLELNPNNPDAFQNMGTALLALGRGSEAVAKYDASLSREPGNVDILNARGAVLVAMRRFDEALQSFDRAVAAQPASAISNFHRAFPLLSLGRFAEGFEAYEWRRRGERPFVALPRFTQPELAPGQDVRGKTLLLYSEQGMGDIIHYARFARMFADKGAKVVVATYLPLVRLLETLGKGIEVVPPQGPAPDFDLTCPMMSAPHKLGLTLETLPAQGPYLSPPPLIVDIWRGRMDALPGLRVGVAWSGNAQYANDWTRSIPLEKLRAIMDVPGVTFVNAQRDLRPSDEVAFAAAPIADFRTLLTDFAETAALVSELDVMVTVDTSLAHLAGAMGKPVWLLLSAVSDWRWLENRSDSPWYPSVRLFRQKKLGDWAPVFAEVKAGLAELAARKRSGQ